MLTVTLWGQRAIYMRLNRLSKCKLDKRSFNRGRNWTIWLKSLIMSKKKEKRESSHYRTLSRISKTRYKRESRDKTGRSRLLSKLKMKTQMPKRNKKGIPFSCKSCGVNSSKERWSTKWTSTDPLSWLSKKSEPGLATQMSDFWLRNSWIRSRLMLNSCKLSKLMSKNTMS